VKVVTVNLGESSYDIQIGSGLLPTLGQRCVSRGLTGRAAVVTNPTVNRLYGDAVQRSLTSSGYSVTMIEMPDGEEFKNAVTLNSVYDALIEAGLDRRSFIVALGGGVVGDLAGFAAATFLRGIPFVQVPTTLLAQVDSSVGGKTAIDHPRGKNLIGAFYQPQLVLVDVETLSTLPRREYCAGLAEVVKYGIALDGPFFDYLERHADALLAMEGESLMAVIQRCCELKAQVVEQDEKETGIRQALNYGHTLGHALETLAGYRRLVHGEAVAVGMALAARICALRGECRDDDVTRILNLLGCLGLSVTPPVVETSQLLDALLKDKKSREGSINFICNQGIGNYSIAQLSPEELLRLSGLGV
jgi:3-dehydroquinate synthase